MEGIYEHDRDSRDLPICWRITNDEYFPHFHTNIEIAYIISGEMMVTLGSKQQILKPKQIAIAPSYTIHAYQSLGFCESFVLIIPPNWVPFCRNIFEEHTFKNLIYEDNDEEKLLVNSLYALTNLLHDDEFPKNPTIVRGYLYLILGKLIEDVGIKKKDTPQHTHFIQDLLAYLQEHYTENLSQKTLAQHFGYSQSRFSHIFNESFGCSVPEYIYSLRCRRAGELLSEGIPILEAAFSSGFSSPRTFYRCFHYYFSMTPTEYLKKHQKNESLGKHLKALASNSDDINC